MYSRYFGLNETPFSIAPDPRYLFMSQKHREALGHLLYGVGVGGGFVLLTGEVGTGKTTICRSLLEQLPGNYQHCSTTERMSRIPRARGIHLWVVVPITQHRCVKYVKHGKLRQGHDIR